MKTEAANGARGPKGPRAPLAAEVFIFHYRPRGASTVMIFPRIIPIFK